MQDLDRRTPFCLRAVFDIPIYVLLQKMTISAGECLTGLQSYSRWHRFCILLKRYIDLDVVTAYHVVILAANILLLRVRLYLILIPDSLSPSMLMVALSPLSLDLTATSA